MLLNDNFFFLFFSEQEREMEAHLKEYGKHYPLKDFSSQKQ